MILDTNILVSSLVSGIGIPSSIVDAWLNEKFILVSHEIQLEELRDVTRRDKFRKIINQAVAGRLVNDVSELAEMPAKLPAVQRSPDPRDDFLLALCEAGRADWLVTGDKADLLSLGNHGNTRVVTAATFAEALGLNG